MAERKEWKDMTRSEKVVGLVVLGAIGLLIIFVVMGAITSNNKSNEDAQKLVDRVAQSLDSLGADTKSDLASTSPGGYQGNILGVEQDSSNSVKVNVSTHFTESGYDNDGGQNIARNIFNAICAEVPELNGLYVKSTTSDLDSRSIYRSDSACK